MKYVLVIIVLIVAVGGSVVFLFAGGTAVESPDSVSSAGDTTELQEDLNQTRADRAQLQEELSAAQEQIRLLEAKAVETTHRHIFKGVGHRRVRGLSSQSFGKHHGARTSRESQLGHEEIEFGDAVQVARCVLIEDLVVHDRLALGLHPDTEFQGSHRIPATF